jgi:hypothetical protein
MRNLILILAGILVLVAGTVAPLAAMNADSWSDPITVTGEGWTPELAERDA